MNNREREQAREELGRWKELRKEKIKKPQDQNWIPSVSQCSQHQAQEFHQAFTLKKDLQNLVRRDVLEENYSYNDWQSF